MKTIFPCLVTLLFLNSCVYHLGNPGLAPGLKTLAISEVSNQTQESSLTALFKNALAERISNEPGMRLAAAGSDEAAQLKLTLKSIGNRSLARARLREEENRDYDGDAYQTVLYRISASVTYEISDPAAPGRILRSGTVEGQADLPKLHDREVALHAALRQLVIDLARNLVTELSETGQ